MTVVLKVDPFLHGAGAFLTIVLEKQRGEEKGYVKIIKHQRHSSAAWSQAGAAAEWKTGQSRHNNLVLTLRSDEDFEPKAASSSLVVSDGGCGNVTQSWEQNTFQFLNYGLKGGCHILFNKEFIMSHASMETKQFC